MDQKKIQDMVKRLQLHPEAIEKMDKKTLKSIFEAAQESKVLTTLDYTKFAAALSKKGIKKKDLKKLIRIPNESATSATRVRRKKIPRNARPCPICNKDKKYKQCCGSIA
jgi:uncharacterized protein YecA (UPF0149 family)